MMMFNLFLRACHVPSKQLDTGCMSSPLCNCSTSHVTYILQVEGVWTIWWFCQKTKAYYTNEIAKPRSLQFNM